MGPNFGTIWDKTYFLVRWDLIFLSQNFCASRNLGALSLCRKKFSFRLNLARRGGDAVT